MKQGTHILIVTTEAFHGPLVEILKKYIDDDKITYIDTYPEIEVEEELKTFDEYEWIKGRQL